MPLAKQLVPVGLARGVDTKVDPKVAVPGTLTTLENGVFTTTGQIRKRFGYTALGTLTTAGVTLPAGERLASFGDELVHLDGARLYSYSSAIGRWADRGALPTMRIRETRTVQRSSFLGAPDLAFAAGLKCLVWEDIERGGVYAAVYDATTGAVVLGETQIHATGTRPLVWATSGTFWILYAVGSTVRCRRVRTSAPSALYGAERTIVTDLGTWVDGSDPAQCSFDVHGDAGQFWLAWINSGRAGAVRLFSDVDGEPSEVFSSNDPISSGTCDIVTVVQVSPTECMTAVYDAALSRRHVSGVDTSGIATVPLSTTAAPANGRRVSAYSGDAGATLLVAIEYMPSGSSFERSVALTTYTRATTFTTAGPVLRSVGLAAKVGPVGARVVVPCVHLSGLQGAYFAISAADGAVLARGRPGAAAYFAGAAEARPRSTLSQFSSGAFAAGFSGRIVSESGTLIAVSGLGEVALDESVAAPPVEVAGSLLVPGGEPAMYDGSSVVEHGFHVFPERLLKDSTSPAGGALSAGKSYTWRVMYEWIDTSGRVHRSAPSPEGEVTHTASGGGADSVTLSIPTLRLTRKSNVRLIVYRTLGDGSVYYRVSDVTSTTPNDPSTDRVLFTDTVSDTALASGELLYTTGDILDNIHPGPVDQFVPHRERVFAVTPDGRVVFSKLIGRTEPVEFSDALETSATGVVAAESMDDRLVVFRDRSIAALVGDGPTDAGAGQGFFLQPVTAEVGCAQRASLVRAPMGLMWMTAKGIHMLDRGLNLAYAGQPVEAYNAETVVTAAVAPDQNQVRFGLASGSALVFDFVAMQWSVFTNHAAAAACTWRGAYTMARSAAGVWTESRETFTDAGAPVSLKLVTGWLSFAGLHGFQRVYRLLVLGDHKAEHTLRVRFAYDYADAWTFDTRIASDTPGAWGSDASWGSGLVWGGYAPRVAWDVRTDVQKCTAIRVSIEDFQPAGESYSITSLGFVVGAKVGPEKLIAARRR